MNIGGAKDWWEKKTHRHRQKKKSASDSTESRRRTPGLQEKKKMMQKNSEKRGAKKTASPNVLRKKRGGMAERRRGVREEEVGKGVGGLAMSPTTCLTWKRKRRDKRGGSRRERPFVQTHIRERCCQEAIGERINRDQVPEADYR